jgi:hypothetical protein
VWLVAHEDETRRAGIEEKCNGPINHRARFNGGIGFPMFGDCKPNVASAMDGAAPKRPAKLFGWNTSLKSAKELTTIPPIKNRIITSVIVSA